LATRRRVDPGESIERIRRIALRFIRPTPNQTAGRMQGEARNPAIAEPRSKQTLPDADSRTKRGDSHGSDVDYAAPGGSRRIDRAHSPDCAALDPAYA
jgi:hypothetical protein